MKYGDVSELYVQVCAHLCMPYAICVVYNNIITILYGCWMIHCICFGSASLNAKFVVTMANGVL